MTSALETVYMVEASPSLREAQKKLLCGDNPMTETKDGYSAKSKYHDIPIAWVENLQSIPTGRPFKPCYDDF